MGFSMHKIEMDTVVSRIRAAASRLPVPRPAFVVAALIAVAIAFSAADVYRKIERLRSIAPGAEATVTREGPAAGEKPPLEAYSIITERNFFGTTGKETAGAWPAGYEGLEATGLPLELLGTIAGDESRSRVILLDREKKKQRVFKIGDAVEGAVITRIMRNAVVLKTGDREEILKAKPKAEGPVPAGAEAKQPPPEARSASPASMRELLVQANARPHFEGGKMNGFIIGKLKDGALLRSVGLEEGDIIQAVNGEAIEKADDIRNLEKFGVSGGTRYSIQVKRKGQTVTLNLN